MLNESWKPPEKQKFEALPEDIYQAVIEDVNPVVRKKYQSEDEEEVLEFKFCVLDEGEYQGRNFWHTARPYVSAPGSQNASWLYLIYAAAMKEEPTKEQLETGLLTASEVNELIGKQVRCSLKVKTSQQGNQRNSLDGILQSKQDLPVPKLNTRRPEASPKGAAVIKDEDIPVIPEGEPTGGGGDIPF